MSRHTLYTVDSKDNVRIWNCWAGVDEGDNPGIYYQDGIEGGKMKDPTFKMAVEKNIGKANYLSTTAQAQKMVDMAVGKKERSNYFTTIALAFSNKLWLPMLAHKYTQYGKKLIYPVISQPKLDGARCNIYFCTIENRVVARTRTGKLYSDVCKHLIEELRPILEVNKHLVFDGELYNHSLKADFEKLMSLARQGKPTHVEIAESILKLEYHIYDVYSSRDPERTCTDRLKIIDGLHGISSLKMVQICPMTICNNEEELDALEEEYLLDGYEGQMVRVPNSVYKVDGRSSELLKKKIFIDDEFPIVSVEEGTANWTGIAKKIIIRLPDGRTQGCGIDGSYAVNRERYENREKLVGKLATVRFFRYTKDGLLYIPVCKDIDRHDL